MNWYRVTRADGSYSWVQANDKSEASRLVRDPGEAIKLVKQVDESEVPASAKGGTPTSTPTETTSTKTPIYDIDLSRASVASELPPATGEERFGAIEAPPSGGGTEPTADQQADYQNYLALLDTSLGDFLPHPKDINDFLPHADEWFAQFNELKRGYQTYLTYYSGYGTSADWKPVDIYDYYSNYDKAQPYFTKWQGLAEEKEAEYTDDQRREYYLYKDYASQYADIADWLPVDIADYFANPDIVNQQMRTWSRKDAAQRELEREYGLSPEEQARRQQEAYEESRYAAQERYGEAPMYPETFTAWLNQQGQFSGALEKYVEGQYPSLRSQFEAQAGRLTGYPTREEARAEATRREAGFQSWLGGEVPGLKQEYWAQRPAERGERLYMQSPNVRPLNW